MILTVTVNAALDRVLFISEFISGETMRTERAVDAVGGKGFDASVALQGLGVESVALGFVAGSIGHQLVGLLDDFGVHYDLVWVEGDTRLSHVVIEKRHHRESHITTFGYRVGPTDLERFLERYRLWLPSVQWMAIGGSLPPGAPDDFYATLVDLARGAGVRTLVDCVGEPARRAAAVRPTILKLNRSELAATFGCVYNSLDELISGVQALRGELGLPNVVVTGGADGILALTEGGVFLAAAPRQAAVNAAGAGDAVSGVLAWRLDIGDTWPEALRWAAAAGAAVTLTERTAECRLEDVERLYYEVDVQTQP